MLLGGALFALLYAGAVPCMFAKLTRHPCPGCGSTRSVLALFHGDVHGVLANNPLGPAAALLMGIFAAQAWLSLLKWGDLREAGQGRLAVLIKRMLYVLAALEFVLWIARFFGFFGGPVSVVSV
ncbi:MAG: DUF2752 domain-containing protein [Labilithrix sp.]